MKPTLSILFISISSIQLLATSLSVPTLSADSDVVLNPYLQILEDESHKLTAVEFFQRQQSSAFRPFEGFPFKGLFQRGKSIYWVFLSINCTAEKEQQAIIRGLTGSRLELYQIENGKATLKQKAGALNSTKQTDIAYHPNDLLITIVPGQSAFLIRYVSIPTHHLNIKEIKLISETAALTTKDKQTLVYFILMGGFLGIMSFMLLFTLFQYAQNKDKSFVYYALYLGSIILHYWRFYDKDNRYFNLMPDWTLTAEFSTLFYLPIIFTYALFLKSFIDEKENFVLLQRFLTYFLWTVFAYFVIERVVVTIDVYWGYRIEKICKPILALLGVLLLVVLGITKDRGPVSYLLYGSLINVSILMIGLLLTFNNI